MARSSSSEPVLVEIITYAPTQFFHCQHCEFVWQQAGAGQAFHREQLESAFPQDLKAEYTDLSNWVRATVETYGGRVVFKIIDAASLEGLVKSVRYGARRYPAFVVDRKAKYIGADFAQAKRLIDTRVQTLDASV